MNFKVINSIPGTSQNSSVIGSWIKNNAYANRENSTLVANGVEPHASETNYTYTTLTQLGVSGGEVSSGGSSAYPGVNHGTSNTTFELTPNTFHVWDEVSTLDLTLSNEISGIANEYLFQFTSGLTPTTLILPDDIKFSEDLSIEANKIYQISILKGLGSVLSWDNVTLIENKATCNEGNFRNGSTLTFEYPTASEIKLYLDHYSSPYLTIPTGTTSITIDWFEPMAPVPLYFSPSSDDTYIYIIA